jgi:hypothetical protein
MLQYITRIFRKTNILKPLGRWQIDNNDKQIDKKVDLSNEDHCGPCGQYALKKAIEPKKKN